MVGCGEGGQGEGLRSEGSQLSIPLSLCGSPKITKSISLHQAPRGSHCPGQSPLPQEAEKHSRGRLGLTLPGKEKALGCRRGDRRASALPLGPSSERGASKEGERGRVSNVLLISEEKVSCCEGLPAGTIERDAGQIWAGEREGGELGRLRQEEPSGAHAAVKRAGRRVSMNGGRRGAERMVSTHLSPAPGQRGADRGGSEETLTSEPGVPSLQPREERTAAAAASRRRVWPGERAGGRGPRRAQSFPLGFPGFRARGGSRRGRR